MSRYVVPSAESRYEVIVGWDPPLETFFLQIFDRHVEEEEEDCVCWVGTHIAEVPTLEALQTALAPWATLPAALTAALLQDRATSAPPSPLQLSLRQLGLVT